MLYAHFLLIIFHYVNQTIPRNRSQSQSSDGLFFIAYAGFYTLAILSRLD